MNYGLTIYGPLEDNHTERQTLSTLVATAFPVQYAQIETTWQTLRDYPDFNNAQIHRRSSGDLVVEIYYSPLHVPEDADCAFCAKISRQGRYE